MVIDQLVFGCGRLTGGATRQEALRLVGLCLDSGVRKFDCAPSYGIGTAETVLGEALWSREDCHVLTKVGSRPDRHGNARTWLRRIKRMIHTPPPRADANFSPLRALVDLPFDWDHAALRASAERSQQLLGQINCLSLHGAPFAQVGPELLHVCAKLADEVGAVPGYASGAVWSSEEDKLYPLNWHAQAAIDPDWLTGKRRPPERKFLTLHTLVFTCEWVAKQNFVFAKMHAAAAAVAGNKVAACVALAAIRVPKAHLIVASASPTRLNLALQALNRIDATNSLSEIGKCYE